LLNVISGDEHIAVDCTSSVKIVIINGVLFVALESEHSLGITPVIKEFSVVFFYYHSCFPCCCCHNYCPSFSFSGFAVDSTFSFTTPYYPSFSPTVVACSGNPPFPPLLSTLIVIVYSGRHTLPPLLLTPSSSSFVLLLFLHTTVGEHVEIWGFKLPTIEFAYDTSVNRKVKAPMRLLMVIGLDNSQTIPIADHYRVFEVASFFASHVPKIHKEITDKFAQNNAKYELRATS